jgi:T5SS/PEP-CTERM-associated repeat protein
MQQEEVMSRLSAMHIAERTRWMSFWAPSLVVFSLVSSLPLARAAISPTGDVSPSGPSTWDTTTTGYIGKTADGTLMVDGDSDLLSYYGYLGFYSGTSGQVTVSGAGSTWTNSSDLYVSYNGSGTLSIANGGAVGTNSSYIGGVSGLVKVDGAGSSFANSYSLYAGYSGDGTLSVTNGGSVSCAYGYIGYYNGSRGTVTVDGAGSTWNNSSTLWAGYSSGGTLSITNGGAVSCYNGYLGYNAGSSGTVTVDGAGSAWTNSSWFTVGEYGSGKLSVTHGGTVNAYGAVIGDSFGSTGTVTVDGAGSACNIGGGLYVGGSGSAGGTGTLSITGGGAVSTPGSSIGCGSGSTGTVTVDGAGSVYNNYYGNLYVGNAGGSGTLSVTNGGALTSSGANIGYSSGSTGVVTIHGAGSTWTNSGGLCVGGFSGSGNGNGTLNVTGGGALTNGSDCYVGYGSGSVGKVTVDGAGSTWTNNGGLFIGGTDYYYSPSGGGTGTLSITNGGSVSSVGGSIGFARTYGSSTYLPASTGAVTVDGAGSTWTNSGDLLIGGTDYLYASGGTGTLSITNGSSVSVAGTTYVGLGTGATGAILFGPNGGTLTTQTLFAASNQLTGTGTINAQGLVSNVDLVFDASHGLKQTITLNSLPNQNVAIHLDMASDPSSNGTLGAGYHGNSSLTIRDGIAVTSSDGYLGGFSGSTGAATITGAGSSWTNNGDLHVGCFGGAGTLLISSGAAVSSIGGDVGYGLGSTGKVTVDGVGSIWTDTSGLYVGSDYYGGGSGTLSISNGGAVTSWGGSVGSVSSSTGTVTVDGAGSTWTDYGGLSVGCGGNGTLSITKAGVVSSYGGSIGASNSGSSGTVSVDGAGSTWNTNSNWLYVGGNGGNGTLSITNGGSVSAYGAYIGNGNGSAGTVTVDGAGSTWTNYGPVYAGCSGSGSTGSLAITHGGSASSNYGYIGSSGSTGSITVDGAGSTWTNSSDLYVGDNYDNAGGSGTLAITHGGNVSVAGTTYVGWGINSTGNILFGSNGGTLTTQGLFVSPTQLSGAGTINTCGLVSDVNLVFDSPSSLTQTLSLNGPGQNVAVNLDMSGASGANGALGAGYLGSGSLTIRNGVAVTSSCGYLGYHSGSMGTATVDGAGSTWSSTGWVTIGEHGAGTLSVTHGGTVNACGTVIGDSSGSTGTVTVDGMGSTWTNSSSLYVGYSGNGTLSITGGGDVSNPSGFVGYIGYNPGAMGVMNVDGAGSTWTNCSDLYVGFYGSGKLAITNGGDVSNTVGHVGSAGGSSGLVTVDGAGSVWTNSSDLYVGGDASYWYSGGTGTLNITNSGTVTNTIGYVGYASGATGIVTVDGPGSKWTNRSYLYVGGGSPYYYAGGNGTLNITNGGTVVNTIGYIGYGSSYSTAPTGTVTVDGPGSTWTNRSDLYVGGGISPGYAAGDGTVSISNGAAVSNANAYLGYASGSGQVTLDGAASKWTSRGNLYVGYSGTGTVTQTGGTNSVAGTVCLGCNSTGSGTYNLNGGVLALSGLSAGDGTAAFNFGGGTLQANAAFTAALPMTLTGTGGNATVNTQSYAVTLSGNLSGDGGLTKSGSGRLTLGGGNTYAGPTNVRSGALQINGASTATNALTNAGGVDVTGGYLVLDYSASGTSVASTVQNLLKTAYNNGTNNFQTGQIRDTLAMSTAGLGLGWVDNATTTQITIMPALYGDANLSGKVDFSDLSLLLSNYGKAGTYSWSQGDFNYDGTVNFTDLSKLLSNYGKSGPLNIGNIPDLTLDSQAIQLLASDNITVSGTSPVPEPSSLVMLASLLALGGAWGIRRQQNRC